MQHCSVDLPHQQTHDYANLQQQQQQQTLTKLFHKHIPSCVDLRLKLFGNTRSQVHLSLYPASSVLQAACGGPPENKHVPYMAATITCMQGLKQTTTTPCTLTTSQMCLVQGRHLSDQHCPTAGAAPTGSHWSSMVLIQLHAMLSVQSSTCHPCVPKDGNTALCSQHTSRLDPRLESSLQHLYTAT